MRVVISADRADEVLLAVLRSYFERVDVRRAISDQAMSGRDEHAVCAAEVTLAALNARLEDAFQEWKGGELSAGMLGRIEAELRPQIDRASAVAVPSPADPSLQRLLEADDLMVGFERAQLVE